MKRHGRYIALPQGRVSAAGMPACGKFFRFGCLGLFFIAGIVMHCRTVFGLTVINEVLPAGQPVVIDIVHRISLISDTIYLKDIAEIHSESSLEKRLAAIEIGRAPSPGESLMLAGTRIVREIGNQTWLPKNVRVKVPKTVVIHRRFQEIGNERFETKLREYLAETANGDELELRDLKLRGNRKFPVGTVRIDVSETDRNFAANPRIAGRISVTMQVMIDGHESGKVYASGWLDRFRQGVCVVRSVRRGTILSAGDVVLATINLSHTPGMIVESTAEVIGQRTRCYFKAGAPLKISMLEDPPIITRGDRVKLIASNGRMTVTTIGIAKSDGIKGERIMVENSRSSKTVTGYVRDAGTVVIHF